ncbi:MAG: peptidylprolyl isomerase [Candidatus Ryanbacteria bacterium]|nr:peptidylprolyl isomerase [Candidatus Ryanbacteria bacterium]
MEQKYIILAVVVFVAVLGGIIWLTNGDRDTNSNNYAQVQNSQPSDNQNTMTQEEATKKIVKATIKTAKGNIVLDLYPDVAPKTVDNFVTKAKAGYFNGLKFHRVEDWVIQGGDPLSRDESKKQLWGTGGGDISTELNAKPFIVGALGVARGRDINISNDSQFFIVKKDAQFLNNQYTLFGQVVSGMEAVNQIAIGDVIEKISVSEN